MRFATKAGDTIELRTAVKGIRDLLRRKNKLRSTLTFGLKFIRLKKNIPTFIDKANREKR